MLPSVTRSHPNRYAYQTKPVAFDPFSYHAPCSSRPCIELDVFARLACGTLVATAEARLSVVNPEADQSKNDEEDDDDQEDHDVALHLGGGDV